MVSDSSRSYGDPVYELETDDEELSDYDLGLVPEDNLEELLNTDIDHYVRLSPADGSRNLRDKAERLLYTLTQREDDRVLEARKAIEQEAENFPPEQGMSEEQYDNFLGYMILAKSDGVKDYNDSDLFRTYEASKMLGAHTYSKTFLPPAGGLAGYAWADHVQHPEIMAIPLGGLIIGGLIGAAHGAHSWYKSYHLGQELENQKEVLDKAYREICNNEADTPDEIKVNLDPAANAGFKFGHWHLEDGSWQQKYGFSLYKLKDKISERISEKLPERKIANERDMAEEKVVPKKSD